MTTKNENKNISALLMKWNMPSITIGVVRRARFNSTQSFI